MPGFRIVAILSLFVTSLLVSTAEATEAPSSRELVILNWADYLDPDLVAEFEAAFDAKVREVYFENDNERDKLLLQSSGEGYDVAIVDGTTLVKYQKRGWIAEIGEARVPNLRHIDALWRNAHTQAFDYAVPYFWGTVGIGYRADLIDTEITSWMQLFQPPEAAKGRIAMVGDTRDLVVPALFALGHSPNSSDPQVLEAAGLLLMAQKPHVRSYTYVSVGEESGLVTGDVTMAVMYSGDALAVQEHHDEITYVVPKEGTLLWVDYLTMLEASKNKELAAAFINFMNEPEIAARQAEYVYYPTPNTAAEAYLPTEFLEDEIIYPPQALLDRSAFYEPVPPASLRRYATIFSTVTR